MRSYRRLAVVGAYGVLSLLFCAPLFEFPNGLGVYDWDQHLFYYGSVLKSVVEYGQLPFWNPWYCGGGILWQNPQIAFLSPVYPLALIVPLPLAMKINIFIHYWIGFAGMHLLLTRVIGLSFRPAVIFLASLFTLSGAPAIHLLAGHSNFLPIFYLPFLLFFACRAITGGRARDAGLAAVPLALALLNGGPHVVPIAVVGIGVFGCAVAASRRQWRVLPVVVIIAAGGLALAAPKLLPSALFVRSDYFHDGRNIGAHPDSMTPEMLARAYLDPYQHPGLRVGRVRHGWWEYGNYVGLFGALLTIASMVWIASSRRTDQWWLGASLALTTIVLFVMSAGEFSAFAPYSLLRTLPFFSSFNVPSRYTLAVPLFAAAAIAWVARDLGRQAAALRPAGVFLGVICLAATADLLVRNRSQFNKVFGLMPVSTRVSPMHGPATYNVDVDTSAQTPSRSPMYRALMENRALFDCLEGVQVVRTARPGEALVAGERGVKLFTVEFSPNRIAFGAAAGASDTRVVLNQNFADGWSSTAGPVVADPQSGRPSVVLPPGAAGRFAFRFRPPGLWTGAIISLIAIGMGMWGWNRRLWAADVPSQPDRLSV